MLRKIVQKNVQKSFRADLRDDERFVVVVAFDEGRVDVGRVRLEAVRRQDDPVPVERDDRLALVLEPVFFRRT
jgi:hypothetical protein